MPSEWFTLIVLTVFAIALFVAVLQDIRSRSINMALTLSLIGLSVAGFATRQEWSAIIAYVILNVISTIWYTHDFVQIFSGGALVLAALTIPESMWFGSYESRMVVMVMGILWGFFFFSKKLWGERGGADFNVIYTTLAVFGVSGYLVFTVVALKLGGCLTALETLLHSKHKTLTGMLFSVYLRFSDPSQRSEPIMVEIRGKKETIPFIPILYGFVLITLVAWGIWVWQNPLVWLPIGIMVILPTGYFIAKRGWERREVNLAPVEPEKDGE